MSKMSISSDNPSYSLGFKNPYMQFEYHEDNQLIAAVELFVNTLDEEEFTCKVDESGRFLLVFTRVPEFFISQDRQFQAEASNSMFGKDTSEAIAFKQCVDAILEDCTGEDGQVGKILGSPQKIRLPFKCDPDKVTFVAELHPNGNHEMMQFLGGNEQFNAVLKVRIESIVKPKRKPTRKARTVIGSPLMRQQQSSYGYCGDNSL